MRLGTTAIAALFAASIPLGARPATAADMPSYYAPPSSYAPADAPQQFGSGWYLRGDAAFGPEDRPKLLLQGGGPTFRNGDALGYAFGAGAGYKFTDWFRVDVTADYLDPFSYGATASCGTGCTQVMHSTLQRFDGLVNGYADLGTYAGLTPYIGAGAGLGGTVGTETYTVDGTAVSSGLSNRTEYRFAWAAMAGISYAVAPQTLLDIGYRYLDLGRTTVSLLPSASVTRSLSAQEVRFGLRYMID